MEALRSTAPVSGRTMVRRLPERGRYDRAEIDAILDAGFLAHVGFVAERTPYVIPTLYVRVEDTLYLHGAPANRMLRTLRDGAEACLTVTLVDGLVLARSTFHHSVNYRSVVVLGRVREVTDAAERLRALDALVDHVLPGRAGDARGPSVRELAKTLVVAMDIGEASAKVRTGPPKDDDEDYALPVWAGVLPLRLEAGEPEPDPLLPAAIEVPGYLRDYGRRGRAATG